jgi:hypothetical protein
MAGSNTTRTLALVRKQGFLAAVVEKWNHHRKIRQDLFGFADVIAVDPDQGQFLLFQTTSYSGFSSRRKKILSSGDAKTWLQAGGRIFVHGWQQKNGKGTRWSVREEEVTLGDFSNA